MLKIVYRNYSEFSKFSPMIKDYLFRKGQYDEETEYDVRLAICELAGNIIKHSRSAATVNLMMENSSVRIDISGSYPFEYDINGLPPPDSEEGRGIFIIKEISQELKYLNGGKDVRVLIRCKAH